MSNDVPQLVIFWLMQCQQLDKKQINTLGNIYTCSKRLANFVHGYLYSAIPV